MFERAQDFETAARLFEEVGDPAKASALYEQSGRHFEAGKLAQARGDADRSIQLLQQVDANHEKYSEAMLILSRLFVQKDMPALAVDKLQRLLGTQQIGSQTLEHYYCLGLAYEQLGKTTEALDTFRKVMTERYGYQDVEQRIQRLTSGAPAPAQSAPVPAEAAPPVAAASAAPGPTPAPPPQAAPAPEPQAAPVPPPAPAPTAQPASSPIQLGTELGKGLLGVTYQAVDTRNQRPVVVKLLRQDLLQDRDTVQRFLQEAKIARAMEHPSLVRMLGIIEVNGHKAAVTEYVEGFDLASFVSRSKHISVKQAVDLLATLSSALGYAHERKLLHRDLKMTNVLVGKGGRLRVAGFGLGALRVPQLGRADGYPPPEFLSGQVNDLRSDIYSLGALIFHAVSGFHPENEQLVANGSTPRLRQIVPDAPEVLEQILMRCLASEPASRFANSTELLAAVRTVQA